MGRALSLSLLFHAMLGVLLLLAAHSYPWPTPRPPLWPLRSAETIFVSQIKTTAKPRSPPSSRKRRLRSGFGPSRAEVVPPSPPQGGTRQTSQSLETAYESRIRAALEERKHYPAMAKSLGQTGRVVLYFVVGKDGTVSRSELLQKSPYPLLNQATKGILEGVTKLVPIPQELHRLSWEFTVPVDYQLN